MLSNDRSSGFGKIFRFITPVLILYVAWTGNKFFEFAGEQIRDMKTDIKTFMQTQANTDKRVDRLEWKVFGVRNEGNFKGAE